MPSPLHVLQGRGHKVEFFQGESPSPTIIWTWKEFFFQTHVRMHSDRDPSHRRILLYFWNNRIFLYLIVSNLVAGNQLFPRFSLFKRNPFSILNIETGIFYWRQTSIWTEIFHWIFRKPGVSKISILHL